MKFKQITIIGVGLIGGSIGFAAKRKGLVSRIIGVTAHKNTLRKAMKRKAIDAGTLEVKESVSGSDMVVLATPVNRVLSTLKAITPYLKEGCIVTDVASVKEAIVRDSERILGKEAFFVGVHPMAGSEQRGIDKARGDLFKRSPCIVTKTKYTDKKALRLVLSFWKALGSKVYLLSPAEHDKRISNISHLPHVVASALSLSAKGKSMDFASTGFGDTTRIAASDPDLWISILTANRKNVVKDIEDYLDGLIDIRNSILQNKDRKLKNILIQAKKKRDRFSLR